MTARSRIVIVTGLALVVVAAAVLWATPGRAASDPPRPLLRGLHIRVWDPGAVAPSVSVNVPVALVTATVKVASLTGILDRSLERARLEEGAGSGMDEPFSFALKGRDIAAVWSAIANSGPVDLVDVEDGAGGRVVIRID